MLFYNKCYLQNVYFLHGCIEALKDRNGSHGDCCIHVHVVNNYLKIECL